MGKLEDYLNNPPTYSEETVKALRYFKAKHKQWTPASAESFADVQMARLEGMKNLVKAIATAEGIAAPDVTADRITPGGYSGNSYYDRHANVIAMSGKLSIITLLHEFAHALLGRDEFEAQRWSICLFKKVYSKSFERLYPMESGAGVFMTAQPR